VKWRQHPQHPTMRLYNQRTTRRLPLFLAENYEVMKPQRKTLKTVEIHVPKRTRLGLRKSINQRPALQQMRQEPSPYFDEPFYGNEINFHDDDQDFSMVPHSHHNHEIPCGMFLNCPTPNCSYIFTLDGQEKHFRCELCRKHHCLNCNTEYHHGKTCITFKREQVLGKYRNGQQM
jgi:hypothetical protein